MEGPTSFERVSQALAFDVIRREAALACCAAVGRERLLEARPFSTREAAEAELEAVEDMGLLLAEEPRLHFSGQSRFAFVRACSKPGCIADAEELCVLRGTLIAIERAQKLVAALDPAVLPPLARRILDARACPALLAALRQVFDDGGEVLDTASPVLKEIRDRIRHLHRSIQRTLERMGRSDDLKECFDDFFVTTAARRYVIPVLVDFKGRVKGVVQGRSQTGATVFMEPMAVVGSNNELAEAQAEEERELTRIFANLTGRIREKSEDLEALLEDFAWFDGLYAKARYGDRIRASRPVFSSSGGFVLNEGRHPLLGEACIPMSLAMEGQTRVVILSGANSGGKTVSLKTLGLISLMAQSGFLVPVGAGTELAFFPRVYCEIGDQQSLAENLSSFSSHVRDVSAILEEAGPGDLLLFDEFMGGTDPKEGAALAEAILEHLAARNVHVVVTTHYGALKSLAEKSPRFRNFAVEFDWDSLQPTFHLLADVPGASYGIPIAGRFGMPEEILAAARGLAGDEGDRLTDLLESLEAKNRTLMAQVDAQEESTRRALRLEERLAEKVRLFEKVRYRELEALKAGLESEVEGMRHRLDHLVAECEGLRRRAERAEGTGARHDVVRGELSPSPSESELAAVEEPSRPQLPKEEPAALRRQMQKTLEGLRKREAAPTGKLIVGCHVRVPGLSKRGTVTRLDGKRRRVWVEVGGMEIKLRLDEVEVSEAPRATLSPSSGGGGGGRTRFGGSPVALELDLRGQRAAEALENMEAYLELAYARGYETVTLIHGKGTGALRQAVDDAMKDHPLIKSHRRGREGEGDFGVTIVSFRKGS